MDILASVPRTPRGPKPTTPPTPGAPGIVTVKAPRWLIDALDGRTETLRADDPLGRRITRQDLVLEVLARAAREWGYTPPARGDAPGADDPSGR